MRSQTSNLGLLPKDRPRAFLWHRDATMRKKLEGLTRQLAAMARVGKVEVLKTEKEPDGCLGDVVSPECTSYLEVKGLVDLAKEKTKIQKKIEASEKKRR